ncbi:hypothetical protein [Micromonospora purpureochromogenes]|uniref:hypothetical protein n=1 Tax=Micromonospora purpureochromogenes TaxID=47872 RepID=UPI0012FD8CBD|nr:hypothetical protein [Micromonospora purpureochromogenes]
MERDWFDWASLVFNTLATSAGLAGLFIAVRAYKVAKEQGRKTFELELLRDMLTDIDSMFDPDRLSAPGRIPKPKPGSYARMLLLPDGEEELGLWVDVYEFHTGRKPEEEVMRHHLVAKRIDELDNPPDQATKGVVIAALHDQVQEAIQKRTG